MANYVFLVLFIIASLVPFPPAAEANEHGRSSIMRKMHTIPFTDDDTECMTKDTCTSTTDCSLPNCICITKINPDAADAPFCISKDCTGKPCNALNQCVYPDCTCNTDGEKPLCQSA